MSRYAKYKEAYTRASDKYQKENTVQYCLKLNVKTDADIIAKLAKVPSKQGYIKELIRKDLGTR